MRICFISMTNLFLCPYLDKYLSQLQEGVEKELLYWNRHGIKEETKAFVQVHEYDELMNERVSKSKKLFSFIRFKRYCESILSNNEYDRIIVLHNYAAVLLWRFLKKKYLRKYVIDIRDYSFERNRLFYVMEKQAIKNSGLAVISSEGFCSFLPKWDYTVCHNDPTIDEQDIETVRNSNRDDQSPINIAFIGMVRFFEQNKKLLNVLGNDKRFVLSYHGQNSDQLEEYAKSNHYDNTVFSGRFAPEETLRYYAETDVINNYYGNNTPLLEYALSNKLYYAVSFRKPILVCPDTFMSEVATKYSLGIVVGDDDTADSIYKKIMGIDRDALDKGCIKFEEKISEDNRVFSKKLQEFLGY